MIIYGETPRAEPEGHSQHGYRIDHFHTKFGLHLFLTTTTMNRYNKLQDLIKPIIVTVWKNKWRQTCILNRYIII